MAASWERLASVTQASDASTLSSGTFTAKKHLKVIGHTIQATPVEPDIRFNNDSGSNYTVRKNIDGGSDSTNVNLDRIYNFGYSPSGTGEAFTTMHIINIADKEKLVIFHNQYGSLGAGTAPTRREVVAKWTNTSDQITRIDFVDLGSGASIDAGSTITVWGADDATAFYPNLPNGTIFEESETGTHYMFDGTDTWNEVT